jgi:hypothetical protein
MQFALFKLLSLSRSTRQILYKSDIVLEHVRLKGERETAARARQKSFQSSKFTFILLGGFVKCGLIEGLRLKVKLNTFFVTLTGCFNWMVNLGFAEKPEVF